MSTPTFMNTTDTRARMHRVWWTALCGIPADPASIAYRRLKRQFADHTMNTWSQIGQQVRPNGRGFYVEGREDHLVTAFFEDFVLLPDPRWFEGLLQLCGQRSAGQVSRLCWSYSYEEVLPGEKRPRIADVVFQWEDGHGQGLLVIEVKKPGGAKSLSEKDLPRNCYYLAYRKFKPIERRLQALLVDEDDLDRIPSETTPTITWQQLSQLLFKHILNISQIAEPVRSLIVERARIHQTNLGILRGSAQALNSEHTTRQYQEFLSLDVPVCIRDWLVGSEVYGRARAGQLPDAPYSWLLHEYDCTNWRAAKRQSTAERGLPLWRI